MAEKLIGSDVPPVTLTQSVGNLPRDMWRDLTSVFRRAPPPPAALPPSTARVLQHLEDTSRSPFGGWQRHLFERSVNAGGTATTRGLLSQPEPTQPDAEDIERGLLRVPKRR
jgi:hypothetical protein